MKRKAGSIVVDRLRDRIVLGRYFGLWEDGDRLPSVREVADLEGVDRKTAAAAYRRLGETGLVRVRPRSGVYLRDDRRRDGSDPLGRLHVQWLEQTLGSAGELGLDPERVSRLIKAVLVVEEQPIPVLDPEKAHAELLAGELGRRTGFRFLAVDDEGLRRTGPEIRDARLMVATPELARKLTRSRLPTPLVRAALSGALMDAVGEARQQGPVTAVVPTHALRSSLEAALARRLIRDGAEVSIACVTTAAGAERACASAERVVLWPGVPGTGPRRDGVVDLRTAPLVGANTVTEVRHEVARLAVEHVNRSTDGSRTG